MTNTTISSNTSLQQSSQSPIGVSQIELLFTLIVFMGIGNGLVGTIGNTSIAIGICREKKMRRRFFVIVQFLAVSRAITGIEAFVITIYRVLRTLNMVNTNMTRLTCYLLQCHFQYSFSLEMMFLLTLVADRTLAVVAYKYYRRLNHKHARTTCWIITAVIVMVKMIPSVIGVDFLETIPCLNALSPLSPVYAAITLNWDVAFAVLILIAYLYLILYVRVSFLSRLHYHNGQRNEEARLLATFNQHVKLLPMLTRLVWLHCGLTLATKIVQSTQTFFSPEIGLRIAVYAGALVNLDVVGNTIVLLAGNKELRTAAFPCFAKSSHTVAPATTSAQPQNCIELKISSVHSIQHQKPTRKF